MVKRILTLLVALCLIMSVAAVASAGKLDEIKERGKLIVGVKDAVVPFGFVDENTNQLVGFDIDICRYIAEQLGVDIEILPVTSATRIPMVAQGQVDLVAATMTHKFERDDVIDFSITYFMDGQKILVAKDSGITSAADLDGMKVGSAQGSTSEKNIAEAVPGVTVVSFDGYPQAFLALKQGKVAAVTTDSTILLGLKNSDENPDNWEIVGEFISAEPYGLGLPENDSDFRDFVNKCLADMWLSGKYQEVYNKWFGPDTAYYLPLDWEMEIWP